jgi:(R)-2-hydroxyglutarate---pyruvate transhydrogenase
MFSLRLTARRSTFTTGNRFTVYQSRQFSHQFKSVCSEDVSYFTSILSSTTSVLSSLAKSSPASESDLETYNTDWMNKYKGRSTTVLKPKTTEEVSKILKYCWEKRIPVVPQGGNTGLVGGSIPLNNEVVLNLSNLSQVRSFDPVSGPSSF